MILRQKTAAAFFVVLASSAVYAQTGAPLLRIGGGARSAAMRGAYTAAAGDVDGLVYNPSGLAGLSRPAISLTHNEIFEGTDFNLVEYGHPIGNTVIGVGAAHMQSGVISGRDENGNKTGDFSAQDSLATLGVGTALSSHLSVGASVKALQSKISDDQASTYAMDAGAMIHVPGRPLWFGASALNMGPGMRFKSERDALPLTLSLGAATRIAGALMIDADLKHEPRDHRTEAAVGLDFQLASALSLRAGYTALMNQDAFSPFAAGDNFRGGFGLNLGTFRIDYAMEPFSTIGTSHRFTVSKSFGTSTPRGGQRE